MPTLYALKPGFQSLLRPLVGRLAAIGVTANQVTMAAMLASVAMGAAILAFPGSRFVMALVAPLLLARMALNAVDGMLAREFGQASTLGAYLNEIGDVVSDLALILPFALVAGFAPWSAFLFAGAAMAAETAGVLGHAGPAGRSYAGPFGKSDRAFAIATVAILLAAGISFEGWGSWLFVAFALAAFLTTVNRIRAGIAAARRSSSTGE